MAAWLHDLERMGSTFGGELQNCPGSENLRKQQRQIGSSTFGNQVKPLSVLSPLSFWKRLVLATY